MVTDFHFPAVHADLPGGLRAEQGGWGREGALLAAASSTGDDDDEAEDDDAEALLEEEGGGRVGTRARMAALTLGSAMSAMPVVSALRIARRKSPFAKWEMVRWMFWIPAARRRLAARSAAMAERSAFCGGLPWFWG